MSDLSWLNPTPHAIAVYASQPLSPAATQHSLPSGRYPLLGPDFHRLDRTSLRLAHLFDHFRQRAHSRREPRPSSLQGTFSGIRTGSLGAGSVGVGVGLGTTTGLGIVSGISMGSEPG